MSRKSLTHKVPDELRVSGSFCLVQIESVTLVKGHECFDKKQHLSTKVDLYNLRLQQAKKVLEANRKMTSNLFRFREL